MNEVHRVVRKAAIRLWLSDLFRTLGITLTVAMVLVLIARIVEQLLGLQPQFTPWWKWGFLGAGGLAILTAVIWATLQRRKSLTVAVELDERAGLREALSTAICVEKSTDPWSQATVENAVTAAKKVDVKKAIPFEAPSLWPVPVATGAALLLTWLFLPNLDLLGATAKQVAEEDNKKQVIQVKADLKSKEQILKEALNRAKIGSLIEDKTDPFGAEKKAEANDPEAIKRSAVKQLTDLTNKIEAAKLGEKAAQAEMMKETLKQLKLPGAGPLDEFSKALSKGDFKKANEQLGELSKQLADAKTTPEEKEKAKEQMKNLAGQLEKLAGDQKQLEKKLEQAGLDKKTAAELAKNAAANPQAVKDAIEKLKNLSPEQKKALADMMKAAAQNQGQCKNMGEALAKAAAGMSKEGLSKEGMEGLGQLSQSLSDSEMLKQDMQNLDAALAEAKKQLDEVGGECNNPGNGSGEKEGKGGKGKFSKGDSLARGNGSGGPGRSSGGQGPEAEAADYKLDKVKANGQTREGPIIGSRLVQGQQVKGESVAEFAEGIQAGEQETADAIDGQQIPRELQDAVKHYFGNLGDKVKASKPAADPTKPADPKPAPAPK